MKDGKETALVKQLLDYLALRRVFAWRQNAGALSGEHKGKAYYVRFTSIRGVSDILGVLDDGRFLAVEAKVRPNRATPEQQAFLDAVASRGGVAVLAYSLDDLVRALP